MNKISLIEWEALVTFLACIFAVMSFTGYTPLTHVAVLLLCVAKAIEILDRVEIETEIDDALDIGDQSIDRR